MPRTEPAPGARLRALHRTQRSVPRSGAWARQAGPAQGMEEFMSQPCLPVGPSVLPGLSPGCLSVRPCTGAVPSSGARSTPRRGDAICPCLLRVRAAEPVHDRGRKRWQRRGCRDTPKALTARSAGGRAGPAWPWRLRRRGARAVPLRRRRGKARAAPLSRPRVTARSRPRPTWRRRPHGRAPRPLR